MLTNCILFIFYGIMCDQFCLEKLRMDKVVMFNTGVVHEDLKNFLESNIPTGKKKSKVALGISDAKLGAGIQESCNINCEYGSTVAEILRGIRFHFHKLIQGRCDMSFIFKFSQLSFAIQDFFSKCQERHNY